jgi:hypothetical protein
MTVDPGHLRHARSVADAILYEGYLLYPYRHNAAKNQARFQFGVLMPPGHAADDDSDRSFSQTECVLEAGDGTRVSVLARFLHLRRRTVQRAMPGTGELADVDTLTLGGREYTCWDEAAEREIEVSAPLAQLLGPGAGLPFHIDGGAQTEDLHGPEGRRAGQLSWRWEPLDGLIQANAERLPGPYGGVSLRVRLENRTAAAGPPGSGGAGDQNPGGRPGQGRRSREDALPHALIAAHLLIAAPGGRFLSMTDPPEWAAAAVAACTNTGTWPVLAGPPECQDLILSLPVILYDHPEVAPESAGPLFDATEIDEILTLRTLALTDEEKRQARCTDPRAADLIDRLDGLPPEMLERLHGAIRYLGPAGSGAAVTAAGPSHPAQVPGRAGSSAAQQPNAARPPWWDPGADTSVSPETDHVDIAGVRVARRSRVRMRPGTRRADAQDLFLAGREAVVEAVLYDVDGGTHLALSLADDPAAELQRSHGRFLYFTPDEVEPLNTTEPTPATNTTNKEGRRK